jgi:predicted transcriptional regulator
VAPLDLSTEILKEIRDLHRRLDAIQGALPKPERTWMTPSEMAEELGVSTRTLQNYVNKGKIGRAAYKCEPRGKGFTYRYHRELTLLDLNRL